MPAAGVCDDIELFQAWCNGDKVAGNALFDRYFDSVYLFFCNKIDHGVEDLTQDTFLAALQGRERFRGDASFRTYLFRTAHNLLYKAYRKRARHDGHCNSRISSVCDLGLSPRSLLVVRHEHASLLAALQRLPLDYQIALELYYWEGLTGPELAAALDIPVSAVRSRLRRGIEYLRQFMSDAVNASDAPCVEADIDRWARDVRDMLVG